MDLRSHGSSLLSSMALKIYLVMTPITDVNSTVNWGWWMGAGVGVGVGVDECGLGSTASVWDTAIS